jgi:hypothetical protein
MIMCNREIIKNMGLKVNGLYCILNQGKVLM